MEYSFLQNFSSLLEVYTAIYVSMFIDDILSNIWTPSYKQKISQLIQNMNIPAISFFQIQVEDNIDDNAVKIRDQMKRKAIFMFSVCMSFLLIAGLEENSLILPKYGYRIVASLSIVSLLFTIFGRWLFRNKSRVVLCVFAYVALLIVLYFTDITRNFSILYCGLSEYKVTLCLLFFALTLPIVWQLFLIWIYSSLYKGYMYEKLAKETYIYGKAFLAYKIKDMAALPKEYETVARDFVVAQPMDGDTSLNSLNMILVKRLEKLCQLPKVMNVFLSWMYFILRGKHNPEAEYIEKNGLDYKFEPPLVESQDDGCPQTSKSLN